MKQVKVKNDFTIGKNYYFKVTINLNSYLKIMK